MNNKIKYNYALANPIMSSEVNTIIEPLKWENSDGYILDRIGGSVAAYSMDKLRLSATSPFTLSFSIAIPNLICRFLNGSIDKLHVENYIRINNSGVLTGVNAYVQQWTDQSGYSNHAVQNTQANQPRIMNNGVWDVDGNGKVTMYFDGSNDELIISNSVSIRSFYSVFNYVTSPTFASGFKGIMGKNGTANSAVLFGIPSNTTISTALVGTTTIRVNGIVTTEFSPIQTTKQATLIKSQSTTLTGWNIGRSDGSGNWWTGNICEIIAFSTDTSAFNIKLERNQIKRFAI